MMKNNFKRGRNMSQMLKQAIVDAKALKEAAFKSAEDALLEKYSLQIKEAVNVMLEQEEPGLDDEEEAASLLGTDEEESEPAGPSEDAVDVPFAFTDGEKLCPCPDEEEEIEIDFDALERQLRAEPGAEEETSTHDELAGDLGMEDGSDEELELDEATLAEMLAASGNEPIQGGADKELGEEVEEDEKDEDDKEEGPNDAKKEPKETKVNEALQAARIKKIVLSEAKKLEGKFLNENKKLLSENNSLIKEKKVLSERNLTFRNKIVELSGTLTEINLVNAKLLYSNEVLMSVSLNERQKTKIVEAITRTGTVEEAKSVYEALKDSVGSITKVNPPKSLSEELNKRKTTFARKQQKTVNPEKTRWKTLAGIKE